MKLDYDTKRIRRARLKRGWNQTELARRAGVNRSTISRLEAGETQNPETVAKVARELRIAISSLV